MVFLPWHISSEETRSRGDVIVRDAIIISGVGGYETRNISLKPPCDTPETGVTPLASREDFFPKQAMLNLRGRVSQRVKFRRHLRYMDARYESNETTAEMQRLLATVANSLYVQPCTQGSSVSEAQPLSILC